MGARATVNVRKNGVLVCAGFQLRNTKQAAAMKSRKKQLLKSGVLVEKRTKAVIVVQALDAFRHVSGFGCGLAVSNDAFQPFCLGRNPQSDINFTGAMRAAL
jgi:hypothetical protein